MADTNIPSAGKLGIASFASHSFGAALEMFYGDKEVTTGVENVGISTTLVAGSVVGRAANAAAGVLILATASGSPAIAPVGILVTDVTTDGSTTTTAEVFKSGQFNQEALTWDATYSTDALKKAAFEGSVAPEIQIGKPRFAADVDLV